MSKPNSFNRIHAPTKNGRLNYPESCISTNAVDVPFTIMAKNKGNMKDLVSLYSVVDF